MRNFLAGLALACAYFAGCGVHAHAQSGVLMISSGAPFSTCPTTNQGPLCVGSDQAGYWNGTKYVAFSSSSGTVTQVTINGVTKLGPTPAFTITGTTTPPTVTSSAAAPSTTIAAQ